MELTHLIERHAFDKAVSTRRMYSSILREFFKCQAVNDFRAISAENLWSYVSHLKNKKGVVGKFCGSDEFSDISINKNINVVRSFFRFLVANKYLVKNPFDDFSYKINPKKVPQKRPNIAVPYEDVSRLINYPYSINHVGKRDRAILTILFSTGVRRSELAKLSIADYKKSNYNTNYLKIRYGKGGTYREAALPQWAHKPVEYQIEQRKFEGAGDNDPLFVSFDSYGSPLKNPIGCKTVNTIVKRYSKLLGLKHVTPHSARVTVATKLLDEGSRDREVQEVLGHSTPQMVAVYDKRRRGVDQSVGKNLCWD